MSFPSFQLLFLLALLSISRLAAGYSSIYAFGDGVCTTTATGLPQSLYLGGSYCNGPVWIEKLCELQGVGYAAAKNISYYRHTSSLLVTNTNDLAVPADAANSLFIIWCADADFVEFVNNLPINGDWSQQIGNSINNHKTAINTLYSKGARVILMPNAVDIMKVPAFYFYNQSERNTVRNKIIAFNTQFETELAALAASKPGLKIIRPNVFNFLDQLLANAPAYGMVAYTGQYAIGDTNNPWTEGVNFVFWDDMHPTAKFQNALANFVNPLIPEPDTVPPVLTLPNPAPIVEATGPGGAAVTFTTSANDAVDGIRPTTATPPSGSTFPLGNTTVTVTASDMTGNTATGNFIVAVRDTTAPTLPTLTNLTREATGPSGAVVTFTLGSATDLVSGSRSCTATPPSGSTFPVGTTTANVSASDAAGNPASGSFKVTVVDMKNLLKNVVITPGGANPPAIAGLIQGGPPDGQVVLQASTDMGVSDPWQDISNITLDSNGNKSFGPIQDPQGVGLTRDFFRIKFLLNP